MVFSFRATLSQSSYGRGIAIFNKALTKNVVNEGPEQAPREPSLQSGAPVLATALGSNVTSFIGHDITISGNLFSKGEVLIEGKIRGNVHCASLIIGDNGQITGEVVAEGAVLHGRVNGSIRSRNVTLHESAHVEGDIYYQTMFIEAGAFFEGMSHRSDNPTSPDARKTSPAKAGPVEKSGWLSKPIKTGKSAALA